MKKYALTLIPLLVVSMSIPALAAKKKVTVEGMFMGANCMYFNKSCPMDMPDAHIATEPDFVLTKPGGTYFYVLNLNRATKARYLHKNVRVLGIMKDKHSMKAIQLDVKKDGKYKTVWTQKAEMDERNKQLLQGD